MTHAETYPGTSVFVNYLGLRDPDKLETAEAVLTARRNQEFYGNPDLVVVVSPEARFSLEHLCAIHRHQFQDVYPWAGVPRSYGMRKGFHREYSQPEDIEPFAASVHSDINQDSILVSESITAVAKRLAHYMCMINIMHPFPEGNGRAQRAFIWLLARDFGYSLPWPSISKAEIHAAAIRLMSDSDKEGIENLVERIIVKVK